MKLRRIGLIAMVAMMLALVAAPVARAQSLLDALGPAGLQDVLASVRYCAGVSKDYQVAENDLCVLNAERVPTRVFKGQEPRKRLTPDQIQKAAAVRKARAEAAKAEADRLLQERIDAANEPLRREIAQLKAEARAAAQRELTANALTRQALEQNRALVEDRDRKIALPMWLVVAILAAMLGVATYLIFKHGAGGAGDDEDPPQGPRGPNGGERKLTHEGLRADEVRKPTTEELPIFSVPPSGEPELPKEEVAPTKSEQLEPSTIRDLSPEGLAAIAALEPQVPEEGAGGETVALTMATGPLPQADKPEERGDEVALRTSGSLAAESLWRSSPAGPSLLPHADRQPIYEEIYDLFVKAEARKDAGTSSELKQLLADASSASSREDIASVEARLVAARERVNKEWLRDVNA